MNYVIGVDGGGTKTEAVAYDLDGSVLESALTGFGNLNNNKEEALENITSAVQKLVEKLGEDGLKGIYLGLAGSEVGDNAKIVYEKIKETFGIESQVMNDGDLALRALLKGEDGVLVIAGTGSIAFGVKGDQQAKVGGWGNLLGDEGSAYKISIEAYKKLIYENDYGFDHSELSKEILSFLEIKSADDLVGIIYSSTKDEIAKVAHLVSKHAENGDNFAIELLETEGREIARQAERVYKKLGLEKCSIGLVGGVIRKSKVFRSAFESYLHETINVESFIDDQVSPAKGAYYIYKKQN
ncbi:MAG: BadF/BadG/BcrA/BcrD ATPase family protein [Clostridium sp.]